MELTKANLEKRLENVVRLYSDEEARSSLIERWNEKGVECSIVMPILEIVLGFDPVTDIRFEASSTEYNRQRMDFVLCNNFVVEAKSISERLEKHYPQLVDKYMKNSGVYLSIITNGVFFDIFIKLEIDIAEKVGKSIGDSGVVKIASISYIDDVSDFFDIMSLFSKDRYKETISRIKNYIKALLKFEGYGKNIKIGIDRKDLEKSFKDMVESSIVGRRGEFWSLISSGDASPGDRFCLDCYEEEGYKIVFEVDEGGMLVIIPDECDYHPMKIDPSISSCIIDVFTKWKSGASLSYVHHKDIIRDVRGLTTRPRKGYKYFKI